MLSRRMLDTKSEPVRKESLMVGWVWILALILSREMLMSSEGRKPSFGMVHREYLSTQLLPKVLFLCLTRLSLQLLKELLQSLVVETLWLFSKRSKAQLTNYHMSALAVGLLSSWSKESNSQVLLPSQIETDFI